MICSRTNPRDGATIGSRSPVQKDGDRDEEDSKPSLATRKWHLQYKKLVEFQRQNGHCIVKIKGWKDAGNKSLAIWVSNQRQTHVRNNMRLDRKELLDQLGFAWKVSARSCTTDVSCR
jgi:hypothetical protein